MKKFLIVFLAAVLTLIFIGTCIQHLHAKGFKLVVNPNNVIIITKAVLSQSAGKGGMRETVPVGLTLTAGYVSETPLYQGRYAILMIEVNKAHITDMRKFLKDNNIDAGSRTKPAYMPMF